MQKFGPVKAGSNWLSSLGALGIVFGDIGTSPLYTFKTILTQAGQKPDAAVVLGSASLVVWTLFLITTVKYVAIAMQIDNDGEGGILALMSLLGIKKAQRPAIVAIGLFGAALIYGDGAITPAISVLSALEGLNMVTPSVDPYIVPASCLILLGLFAIQSRGTAKIGHAFGPIMFVWFACIAVLGLIGLFRNPAIFAALDPRFGIRFLLSGGWKTFLVLGGVILCVTGAEALYADMGHFGSSPIRRSWFMVVFPALILNYLGQAALVLDGGPSDGNIFYRLCPEGLLIPMVGLATVATIIASQSIITGAFSMTRQAIQLGWLPRLDIQQTSEEGYGQIYVGAVNWLLMIVTIGLTVGFRKSDNLAAAFGIAVSATMLMTSFLLFIAMLEIWKWDLLRASAIAGLFIIIDGAFFVANSTKLVEGGYVPLLLAIIIYGLMWIWHHGSSTVRQRIRASQTSWSDFFQLVTTSSIARVPGTAVFLTRAEDQTPPVLSWHVKHSRSLHTHVLVLRIEVVPIPFVREDRLDIKNLNPGFWQAVARYGFMERPDIPTLVGEAALKGCEMDRADVTYFVGHETIVRRDEAPRMNVAEEALFAAMVRNSAHVSDFFRLPRDQVIEIGREIAV